MEDPNLPEWRKKLAQAKQHLKENKTTYFAAAGGMVVGGGIIGITLLTYGDASQVVKVKQFMGIGYKCTQNATTIVLQAKGDPGDVVMRVSDGMKWPSKNELARDQGIHRNVVTRYFKGEIPDIRGETYIDLGKAGHPVAVPSV